MEPAGFHIHQEFDGARAFIVHVFADAAAQIAQFRALFAGQIGGRGAFDDFLVAALDRTVALKKMIHAAMPVAEDLNLHMAGAGDHLFQIALAIAKGGFGFAAAFQNLFLHLVRAEDRAHPATATAPAGFQHQGIADFRRLRPDRGHVVTQHSGCRDDRHARLDRDPARSGLVPQRPHGFRPRADEGDPVRGAGIDEIRVFGQEPIAGVDRIRPALPRHPDHSVNREIRRDGAHALADPVSLIRFEAVQAELVFPGKDGDGAFAHLIGRAHHADGDLAPVRDQDFTKFGHGSSLFPPRLFARDCAALQRRRATVIRFAAPQRNNLKGS